MKTTVMTILDAKEMLEKMVAYMEENFSDFKECRENFLKAVAELRSQLGDEPIDKMLAAIDRRSEADMLFCGSLGYQANLANFRDPVARTFMDVDFEDYLRVDVLGNMPQRDEAERELNDFYHSLTEEQKEIHDAISSYLVSLELDLTKLAHYRGFMFANHMLYFTEPGYHSNFCLTLKYQSFMEDWFHVQFDDIKHVTLEDIEAIKKAKEQKTEEKTDAPDEDKDKAVNE